MRLRLAVALLTMSGVVAGCDDRGRPEVLRVSAAASLTEVFTELAERFEANHARADVVLTFGGSPALVTQLREGSPADVLVTADETSMRRAVVNRDARDPVVFATNQLALVVEPGNPRAIARLDDLTDPRLTVAVCAPTVPCGRLASEVLGVAGVDLAPASQEQNVKAVLTKVVLGEVDAGIVYETDAISAGADVERLTVLPAGADAPSTEYLAAVTTASHAPELAERWLALLRSSPGRVVLEQHGFRPA